MVGFKAMPIFHTKNDLVKFVNVENVPFCECGREIVDGFCVDFL